MDAATFTARRAIFAAAVGLLSRALGAATAYNYTFALIPKNTISQFFETAHAGCIRQASKMENVSCLYVGPKTFDPTGLEQAKYINDLVKEGVINGMSISVVNPMAVEQPIARAVAANITVVTFDSDAPESDRAAYIGTNNTEFGDRLASVLMQVNPIGGNYAVITSKSPNVMERTTSFRETLAEEPRRPWRELNDGASTIYYEGNDTETLGKMIDLAEEYPYPQLGAMALMQFGPMRDPGWTDLVDANRNMTFVSADANMMQITLLRRNYTSALVGQLPYEMGELSVTTLFKLVHEENAVIPDVIHGTALVEMVRVPLNLPPPDVDFNYIGEFRILGFVLYAIVVLLVIVLTVWTVKFRKDRVVRASQPPFLLLICLGTLIFASTIIPLGVDDNNASQEGANTACMCRFWLVSVGFVLVFSAMAAKTWRINRIFHNPNRFRRVKVTVKDVMLPLVCLLVANVIVMICWEILAPLEYMRFPHPGTDEWNRVISTYGKCRENTNRKGGAVPYLVSLAVIDFGALIFANVQAYRARDIRTEFSESKWIALSMLSMLQVSVIGFPVLYLVETAPQPFYVLAVLMIFLLSTGILLLMFVPKIAAHVQWQTKQAENEKAKEQRATAQASAQAVPSEEPSADDGAQNPDDNDVTEASGLRVFKLVKEP